MVNVFHGITHFHFEFKKVVKTQKKMMGMGTPAASPATAAFWQQARQLPHMNTFQANSAGMGHNLHGSSVPHQYGHTHHTSQPHDAKMAEKIVSELQVK